MDARHEQVGGALATEVMNAGLRGEDWQTTRQFLKTVDWFVQDNPGVWYAWGMCALKLGDRREAQDKLEKAVRLAPTFNDPALHCANWEDRHAGRGFLESAREPVAWMGGLVVSRAWVLGGVLAEDQPGWMATCTLSWT